MPKYLSIYRCVHTFSYKFYRINTFLFTHVVVDLITFKVYRDWPKKFGIVSIANIEDLGCFNYWQDNGIFAFLLLTEDTETPTRKKKKKRKHKEGEDADVDENGNFALYTIVCVCVCLVREGFLKYVLFSYCG